MKILLSLSAIAFMLCPTVASGGTNMQEELSKEELSKLEQYAEHADADTQLR